MPMTQEGLARLVHRDGVSPDVVEAFRNVDRAAFVPIAARREAYRDRPVGIPEGQTTSQPSLIARMIDALSIGPDDRVLEVGTGFGFQTALLTRLAREVFSIERHAELAEAARRNLAAAGIDKATVDVGDGWRGLPEFAPYDAIIVSAAATEVPRELVAQLRDAGRMVIPVDGPTGADVILFQRHGRDLEKVRVITPARFVPLVPGRPE